jgi:RNA-directed DNA polymerase
VDVSRLDLPVLAHAGDLGPFFEIDDEALAWLADCEGHEARRRRPTARHYHYQLVAKASGGERLIEAPKARLKAIQRRLLRAILERVPVHEGAHAFVRGRSAITGAAVHTGQAMVIRVDLRDFFASIPASRVHALFARLGYPHPVCRLLTGLCTNVTPPSTWGDAPRSLSTEDRRARWHRIRRYATPHLPAGAPTSPALANLAAFRLDCRLSALATSMGCAYTRYADDLTISGGDSLRRGALAAFTTICRIVAEEGFVVHAGKTRFRPQAQRQRVTGLVVNTRPNVPREDYDRLKAILFNCARFGPRTQSEQPPHELAARLRGEIEWCAVNPRRGEKLRELFARIDWT